MVRPGAFMGIIEQSWRQEEDKQGQGTVQAGVDRRTEG